MIRAFQDDYGVQVLHAWGMTEMSPLGTVVHAQGEAADAAGKEEQLRAAEQAGPRDLRRRHEASSTTTARSCPGTARPSATCRCAGPGSSTSYFKGEGGDPLKDGWFPTGDVATIDPDGYMQITDRSKDVIKSGGEWISSIDLENIAVGAPGDRRGRGDRRAAPEVGRAARSWSW